MNHKTKREKLEQAVITIDKVMELHRTQAENYRELRAALLLRLQFPDLPDNADAKYKTWVQAGVFYTRCNNKDYKADVLDVPTDLWPRGYLDRMLDPSATLQLCEEDRRVHRHVKKLRKEARRKR